MSSFENLAKYLEQIKKSHRQSLGMVVIAFIFSNMAFYNNYIYSEKFPDIYKTQTWQVYIKHNMEHTYEWAVSWVTNPTEIPYEYLLTYFIFTGFWTFFFFLLTVEPYFLRMKVWEEALEKQGFTKDDFKK